jgi:hypothetical protein
LMDNCPADLGEEILSFLRDVRMRIIAWSSQPTQIFQKLDICLFGVSKQQG